MKPKKIGVWFVGILSSLAATAITGTLALRRGLTAPTGMVTALDAFSACNFMPLDALEFGGCDIRPGHILHSVRDVVSRTAILDLPFLLQNQDDLIKIQNAVTIGTVHGCARELADRADSEAMADEPLREQVFRIRRMLRSFRRERGLDLTVVVNLGASEHGLEPRACHETLEAFEAALDANDARAASAGTLYAYAALQENCPFIDYADGNAALIPAIIEMAEKKGLPVMGSGAKRAQALLESVLASMFVRRNLRVVAWDGLHHPHHPAQNGALPSSGPSARPGAFDDRNLPGLLGYMPPANCSASGQAAPGSCEAVLDMIQFKGFLNMDMSLQLTWQGCDSALAAPMILDLVRLVEWARRQGDAGLLPYLAFFFKSPLGAPSCDPHEQYRLLFQKLCVRNPECRAPRRPRAVIGA